MGSKLRSPLVVVGLVALLALLATLQYRWIGTVSEAERERIRSALHLASLRLADDLDREVTRVFLAFHADGGDDLRDGNETFLAEHYRWWNEWAPYPQLVQSIAVLQPDEQLLCFETDRGLMPCQPEEPLDRLLAHLHLHHPPPLLEGNLPAVIVVLDEPPEMRSGFDQHPPVPPPIAVLRLDQSFITGALLPELIDRYFTGLDGTLAIFGPDNQLLFCSEEDSSLPVARAGDLELDLLGLRSYRDLPRLVGLRLPLPPPRYDGPMVSTGPPDTVRAGRRPRRLVGAPRDQHRLPLGRQPDTGPPARRGDGRGARGLGVRPHPAEEGGDLELDPTHGRWRLVVTHSSGSLQQAVSALRLRNLVVSGAILLLLGGSLVMIIITSRRAQWLARQQIELVTGVSHELKTPLAAIRSAAENLAHGVVTEPDHVRRYGELVDREGKRLSHMVTELLELAGMHSSRPDLRRQPVPLAQVVDGALEDCRWTVEEQQIEVSRHLPPQLPAIQGDADALRRAVRNLVDNAARHGGSGGRLVIRATVRKGRREVTLTVADRGAGISRADLPHIFEPFYRGRRSQASGSGLGLAMVKSTVERHGGRISIDTGKTGTAITIHLPAAGDDPDATAPPGTNDKNQV